MTSQKLRSSTMPRSSSNKRFARGARGASKLNGWTLELLHSRTRDPHRISRLQACAPASSMCIDRASLVLTRRCHHAGG
eukprot:scaffold37432_cov39-Phaeocystis_antarctica.AAC.1